VVRLASDVDFANVGSYRKGSHHIVPAETASLKRVLKRTRRQCVMCTRRQRVMCTKWQCVKRTMRQRVKDDRRRVVVFVAF
jgi:hypothetical protein